MNRRGFLAGLLAGAGAAAAGELIVPNRSIFLPPAGGWKPWLNKFENITQFGGSPYLPRDFTVSIRGPLMAGIGDLVQLNYGEETNIVRIHSISEREDGFLEFRGTEESGIFIPTTMVPPEDIRR